jgi:hypothetical protein
VSAPTTAVWLTVGYALLLLAIAYSFDAMAKKVSHRASRWRTGKFVYHSDHDAWVCPQDQWLWPSSFDPTNRVMRYRGSPTVCNACPVKASCTSSEYGREITREIDPWPHSEAGRFHRGVACFIAALGALMPMVILVGNHAVADVLVLATTSVLVALAGLPLARHLWNTPSNAPEHIAHRSGLEDQVAAAIDRYSTRWGSWEASDRR